ncbi:8297_t:CDS:2, partial [Cetraspora pellucida]
LVDADSVCYDRTNPFQPHEIKIVPCPMVTKNTTSSSSKLISTNNTNMFELGLACNITDQVLCGKVQRAFTSAGQILSDAIIFTQTIRINATFIDICAIYGMCTTSSQGLEGRIIGAAAPARSMVIDDGGGVYRFYPQALVKQKNIQNHPEFGPDDIIAVFNSNNISYWFEEDGVDIKSDQFDFLMIILHELIHGLGFSSSFNDHLILINGSDIFSSATSVQALAPYIVEDSNTYHFVEAIFDKYMYELPSGPRISNITAQMDVFGNTQYLTPESFLRAFLLSPQSQYAKQLYLRATTPNSLGLLPDNTNLNDAIILETSFVPFSIGSSISHFSYKTYSNTSDFLMRFATERGISLKQHILNGGNYSYDQASLPKPSPTSNGPAKSSSTKIIPEMKSLIYCMLIFLLINRIMS